MRVAVVRPDDLGPAEAERWRGFQARSVVTTSPFLSLTYVKAVGLARPATRVAVVEEGGRIEAFLPFEPGDHGVARPIGAPMTDLQGFLASGEEIDPRQVLRTAGLRGWRFEHAPAEHAALASYGYRGSVEPCPVVDLDGGYDAYLATRGRSFTKRVAAARRALERQLGPVSLVWRSADAAHLEQLIRWKTDQYVRTGVSLLFSYPPARRLVEELSRSGEDDCTGVVSVLTAGERPVAIHFGIASETTLCDWFPAYDPEAARFSPGLVMWLAVAEATARSGRARIDLGYGAHRYKTELATGSYPLAAGAVWARRSESLLRNAYRRLVLGRRSRGEGRGGAEGQGGS